MSHFVHSIRSALAAGDFDKARSSLMDYSKTYPEFTSYTNCILSYLSAHEVDSIQYRFSNINKRAIDGIYLRYIQNALYLNPDHAPAIFSASEFLFIDGFVPAPKIISSPDSDPLDYRISLPSGVTSYVYYGPCRELKAGRYICFLDLVFSSTSDGEALRDFSSERGIVVDFYDESRQTLCQEFAITTETLLGGSSTRHQLVVNILSRVSMLSIRLTIKNIAHVCSVSLPRLVLNTISVSD